MGPSQQTDRSTEAQPASVVPVRFVPMLGPRLKVERARDTRGTVRRLASYLGRHRLTLLLAGLIAVMGVALDLTAPYLLGQAIDRFLIRRKLDGLKRIGGLMLATYAGSCLLNLGQSRQPSPALRYFAERLSPRWAIQVVRRGDPRLGPICVLPAERFLTWM